MTGLAGTTMMFRNLRFALNSAWQSFWRNLAVSLAAVLSITLILLLGGGNLLIGHAFSHALDGFREQLRASGPASIRRTPPTTRGTSSTACSSSRNGSVMRAQAGSRSW